MFVGEAPGADEDAKGEPFVGRAGQLLTKIINTMGYQRGDIYLANVLKCRPDTPGQAFGNRPPTLTEMHSCRPCLFEQIDIIQPKAIVALGATAMKGLLDLHEPMRDLARALARLQGHPRHGHISSLVPPAQPTAHGEAKGLGGPAPGQGTARPPHHRPGPELFREQGLTFSRMNPALRSHA